MIIPSTRLSNRYRGNDSELQMKRMSESLGAAEPIEEENREILPNHLLENMNSLRPLPFQIQSKTRLQADKPLPQSPLKSHGYY